MFLNLEDTPRKVSATITPIDGFFTNIKPAVRKGAEGMSLMHQGQPRPRLQALKKTGMTPRAAPAAQYAHADVDGSDGIFLAAQAQHSHLRALGLTPRAPPAAEYAHADVDGSDGIFLAAQAQQVTPRAPPAAEESLVVEEIVISPWQCAMRSFA